MNFSPDKLSGFLSSLSANDVELIDISCPVNNPSSPPVPYSFQDANRLWQSQYDSGVANGTAFPDGIPTMVKVLDLRTQKITDWLPPSLEKITEQVNWFRSGSSPATQPSGA